jgi:hypothetical protein
VLRLNAALKWAWLENPQAKAMSANVWLDSVRSDFALLMRLASNH